MIRTSIEGGRHSFDAGTLAGAGAFECVGCGYSIALQALDEVPGCPNCSGHRFRRSSIFGDHAEIAAPGDGHGQRPDWLDETRSALGDSGRAGDYVAWEDGDGVRVCALDGEWTRIGRSMAAHIRFDDPTLSRRHAVIHREGDVCRVLDDRSLNGVFLNGARIDWHELDDGDEIAVGRFRLHFIRLIGDEAATGDSPSEVAVA